MTFWGCLDDLIRNILQDQFLFVIGDFNGHIGSRVNGYQGIHGGFDMVLEMKIVLHFCNLQ